MKKEKKQPTQVNAAIILKGIKKEAAKHYKKLDVTTIKNNEQLSVVVSNLKALKELRKLAEEKYDAIYEPIKKAAKDTKAALDDLFNPFFLDVDNKDTELKEIILKYSNDQESKIKQLTIGKGGAKAYMQKAANMEAIADNMQVKGRFVATITNIKKVPHKFLTPNMVEINKACKAGKVPPGVKWAKQKSIAI